MSPPRMCNLVRRHDFPISAAAPIHAQLMVHCRIGVRPGWGGSVYRRPGWQELPRQQTETREGQLFEPEISAQSARLGRRMALKPPRGRGAVIISFSWKNARTGITSTVPETSPVPHSHSHCFRRSPHLPFPVLEARLLAARQGSCARPRPAASRTEYLPQSARRAECRRRKDRAATI